MEHWRDRIRRECGEMAAGIRAALALSSDEAARIELERLTALPYFGNFTWLWAPALMKRNRVMFRPFVLSNFDRSAMDADGEMIDAWKGDRGAALQALLDEVDAADDIELTKRLYTWQLAARGGIGDGGWRTEVVERFRKATSSAARHVALAKIDPGSWMSLDAATALELWKIDRVASRKFILGHLGWGTKRADWQPLLDASRTDAPDFHFELYRKVVDEAAWKKDVLALPVGGDISAELEKRHPGLWSIDAGGTFYALLEKHGAAAIAYVKRHLRHVAPRYSWHGKTEGKGLPELLEMSTERGWIDLWAALLRTSATPQLFDAEVRKLVKAGKRDRLAIVPGRGAEFHGQGWSYAHVHALTDETACQLYAKYPDLARGPYRMHVTPTYNESFPKLIRAAIAAKDDDLVDFMASRVATQHYANDSTKAAVTDLVRHYEGLDEPTFVRRAGTALSRMPAFQIWSYPQLLTVNALAKLLFEHSTQKFLADGAAVRDLLESPQIHVQLLAYRILGQDDPRAAAIAAEHVDLVQATLLRKLHAKSRKLAFGALRRAASHDEATARYLLGRMRDALELPEKRYPTEELVGLIGFLLHRWPALRGAREQPVVYGLGGQA